MNINFNNILKIKKQYSLNLAKSNDDSSKNTLYNNKDKIKIKNYFSSIPLSFDKKRERKNNKTIKYYSRNHRVNIKNDSNNPKYDINLKSNNNYSSMLKQQFLGEQLYKKNI